jgi:hypothetical protein
MQANIVLKAEWRIPAKRMKMRELHIVRSGGARLREGPNTLEPFCLFIIMPKQQVILVKLA